MHIDARGRNVYAYSDMCILNNEVLCIVSYHFVIHGKYVSTSVNLRRHYYGGPEGRPHTRSSNGRSIFWVRTSVLRLGRSTCPHRQSPYAMRYAMRGSALPHCQSPYAMRGSALPHRQSPYAMRGSARPHRQSPYAMRGSARPHRQSPYAMRGSARPHCQSPH